MKDIEALLVDRKNTHGNFVDYADTMQDLNLTVRQRLEGIDAVQEAALYMILSKVARILNGNPNEIDHWVDIQGYASLVEINIKEKNLYTINEDGAQ